jgi:hypothetical protein
MLVLVSRDQFVLKNTCFLRQNVENDQPVRKEGRGGLVKLTLLITRIQEKHCSDKQPGSYMLEAYPEILKFW